ncbi:MAG: RagB/SusD family nutrient uptake outer membrane protein [Bacteroidales bacterium]|nr:RagB/SusD family nutrient uptake outer membrane protein [Bacteroidales bacterium]
MLPETYDNDNTGRATRGAALALLGKTYLYQQKWAQAIEYLGIVIDLGVYQLSMPAGTDSIDYVNAYLCNFTSEAMPGGDGSTYTAENNCESVFEIQNNDDPPIDHPAGLKYDPRRYASVFAEGDTIENREGFHYYNEPFDSTRHVNVQIGQGYQVRKYYYPLHSAGPDAPYNDPNNWRYLRYADVLLMYAEAEYHLNGSTPVAIDAINQVRARAGMPGVTQVTPEVIIHERDVELGLECLRFHDLVRWSLLPEPWVDPVVMVSGYVAGKNEYLPIPIEEITKSEGLLKQNPGW